MTSNARAKRTHDEDMTVEGKTYLCHFEQDAPGRYRATCGAMLNVIAYGSDLPNARTAISEEIAIVIFEQERRYEEEVARVIQLEP